MEKPRIRVALRKASVMAAAAYSHLYWGTVVGDEYPIYRAGRWCELHTCLGKGQVEIKQLIIIGDPDLFGNFGSFPYDFRPALPGGKPRMRRVSYRL
jgi:hypothetical protein